MLAPNLRTYLHVCLTAALSSAAYQRATGCEGHGLTLTCPAGERISIDDVSFAYDPKPCQPNRHEDNNCTLAAGLSKDIAAKCNGHESCSTGYYDPSIVIGNIPAGSKCLIGNVVYTNEAREFNLMAIIYRCQSYTFCKQVDSPGTGVAVVKTDMYPAATARSSSACQCSFSAKDREVKSFSARVTCPDSTVLFRYETKSLYSDSSLIESGEFRCHNEADERPVALTSVPAHRSLTVSVDEGKSSERSAYSLRVVATKLSGQVDPKTPVSISCEGVSVIFTQTEKIIIGITLPAGVFIVIACLVTGRCLWIRRKKRVASQAPTQIATMGRRSSAPTPLASAPLLETPARSEPSASLRLEKSAASLRLEKTAAARQSGKMRIVHAAESLLENPDGADLASFAAQLHRRRQQQQQQEEEETAARYGLTPKAQSRPTHVCRPMCDHAPSQASYSRLSTAANPESGSFRSSVRDSLPGNWRPSAPPVDPRALQDKQPGQAVEKKASSSQRMSMPPPAPPPIAAASVLATQAPPRSSTPSKPALPPKPSKEILEALKGGKT